MKLTVTVLAVCVLLSGCVVAAAAVSHNHGGVSSPPVPVFHNVGMDWQYTDANGTLLGHCTHYPTSLPFTVHVDSLTRAHTTP